MKLTPRDERLIRDIALSHVLSRDQVIRLGYFTSVTRLNTRLRELRSGGLVSVLDTPFFDQHLYVAGKNAPRVVGEHIASLLSHRAATPRFLQHALAVTESRTALLEGGGTGWRFEAQLRHSFLWSGRTWEIRPDGLVRRDGLMTLLEVDMGHVDPGKFGKKLKGYEAFIESGELARVWGEHRLAILTLTTGALRRTRLARRVPSDTPVCFSFLTFDDLRIRVAGGWS